MLAAPVSIEARAPIFLNSTTNNKISYTENHHKPQHQYFEAVSINNSNKRQGGGNLSVLQRGLQEAPSAGNAGAAESTTPRVMKDEILSSQGVAAPAPTSDGVGGWQPVTKSASEAPSAAEHAPSLETSQLDPRAPVRKGKWTPEEEKYTTRIINDFNKGLLPLAPGTTLRSYLSEKLNCDPMRITKKFAGASCIGKRVFMPVERTPESVIETHRSRRDLEEMARKFHIRLESMRPGGGGRPGSGSSSKSSSGGTQSSPKTRRSTSQAAGTGGGGGAACGTTPGGGGARRGDTGPSHSCGGSGGVGARTASRSPSPGAHGPHSACDDSAPHPEGSPSHRQTSSWGADDADGEGYGQYDPMDQSPSVDSDASSSSSSRVLGYTGANSRGVGYGGAAAAAAAAAYGIHSGGGGGGMGEMGGADHTIGYPRCRCDECRGGGGAERGTEGGTGQEGMHVGYRNQQHKEDARHQRQQQPGHDGFHRHGARRSYNFQFGTAGGGGDTDDTDEGGGDGDLGGGAGGRMSPMSPSARVGGWGGRASPTRGLGPIGAPRTLPPAALAAAVIRDGAGGGSGARSPTWPLPRVIPEGSEISDQDAGGLLLGFFQKVHEKAQTAADELGEELSEEGASKNNASLHPLMASKRGCRSISSPALTQFAHYAEQLPRMQTPTFKRRKSVASFV